MLTEKSHRINAYFWLKSDINNDNNDKCDEVCAFLLYFFEKNTELFIVDSLYIEISYLQI